MASSQSIIKDALSIYDRLFCHRPALQGEIKFLIREMESKRNDREMLRLREVQAKAEKVDRTLPECEELAGERLKRLQESLQRATDLVSQVLSEKVNEDEIRAEMKLKRNEDWDKFQQEIEKAKEDVERIHQDRMEKLESENENETTVK